MKDWSTERIMRLISLYRDHPILWDPDHKDYRNSHLKNETWTNISKELGCRDVEKKMNILIVQYRREMRKIRERGDAEKSASNCSSKWFAFEALSFLKEKKRVKKKINSNNITCEPVTYEMNDFDDQRSPEDALQRTWTCQSSQSITENAEYDTPSIEKHSKEQRDEYTVFGEMISIKLRKLPSLQAKKKAMNMITDAIFQVEIESEDDCETEMVYVKMDRHY